MKIKYCILIIFVVILFIIALILRSKFLFSGDFYFLSDQARDLLLVRDMIETHKPPLIGARAGLGGLFHGPLWIWFLSLPFIIFNGDVFKITYAYIFISFLTVVSVFFWGKILYGWKGSIFALLLVTFSPKLISIVPLTTNAQVMPLIFSIYFLFLILYFRGNRKCFFVCAFISGLGFHFQQAFSFLLLPYLIIVSFFKDKIILNIKNFLLTLISFFLPLSTYIIFDLKHKFLITSSVINLFVNPNNLQPMKGYEKYSNFLFRISDRYIELTKIFNDLIPTFSVFLLRILIIILIVSLILFLFNESKELKKEFFILLFFPVFVYSVYIIYPYPIWEHYVYSIPIIAIFLVTISFLNIFQYKFGKIAIYIFLFLFLKTNVSSYNFNNFFEKKYLKNEGSYLSQLKVVDYVFENSKNKNFGYFVYTPQILTYSMDYLFWWRGKYKYNYFPISQKINPFYLIMYPPLKNDDNAHEYWIKNKIRTNSNNNSKIIIDGITIKKLIPTEKEDQIDQNYYLNIR